MLFASPVQASGLWGTIEFRADSLAALPKWRGVLERMEQELPRYHACESDWDACTSAGLVSWRQFIEKEKNTPRAMDERMGAVNYFLNRWRYVTDDQNWYVSDYWATPGQFVEYSGDCEDYAIAKYATFKALGVSFENLRIAVVKDTIRQLNHAVLIVYVDGKSYVLDSLFDAVLSDRDVTQYTPYYSINEATRWAHITLPQ